MQQRLQRAAATNNRRRDNEITLRNSRLPQRAIRKKLLRLAALLIFCAGAPQPGLHAADVTEQQVKAGFVYNFVRFIDWPETAITADQQLRLCLLGKSDVAREMEVMMQGKPAKGHTIQVAYIRTAEEEQGCHVIFVDASERRKVKPGVPAASGALVIGDFDGFARQGGIINFVIQNNKISFDINLAAAERAGLKVSSRLLSVAHTVIE